MAFAGGVTGGIATALALLYNGLLLGVIGGLMGQAGNGVGFVDLVTAHGVLELSCILVAGAAGLSLGWSIISPGLRTRRASLQREARRRCSSWSGRRRGSWSPGSWRGTAPTSRRPASAR